MSIAIAIAMLCAECELCVFTARPTEFPSAGVQNTGGGERPAICD